MRIIRVAKKSIQYPDDPVSFFRILEDAEEEIKSFLGYNVRIYAVRKGKEGNIVEMRFSDPYHQIVGIYYPEEGKIEHWRGVITS